MGLGLHHNGMHDFLMDELELGFRAASFLDDETYGLRLWTLPVEVDHWHCPTDDYEHRRIHGEL